MKGDISLAGRVVVVTGAGRGLGRAHARLLAARGASVVINDMGVDRSGDHADPNVAAAVANEIRNEGNRAADDSSDLTTPAGGQSVVDTALHAFGRLDAVVNNAGIYFAAPFDSTDLGDFERIWRVNVGGHVNVIKAAWPIMSEAGGGRIVTTGSGSGLYGIEEQTAYGSAKAAIYGLTRALALEGRRCGIKVNMIAPGGVTRMLDTVTSEPEYQEMIDWTRRTMPPELVSPAVAWLVSDLCDVTGQAFTVWAGRVARVATGCGPGLFDPALTPERLADGYEAVSSLDGFFEPLSSVDDILTWRSNHPEL